MTERLCGHAHASASDFCAAGGEGMNSAERDPCPSCGFSDTAYIVAALNRLTAAVYVLAAATFWEQAPARNDDEWDDVRRGVAAIATELRKAVEP